MRPVVGVRITAAVVAYVFYGRFATRANEGVRSYTERSASPSLTMLI